MKNYGEILKEHRKANGKTLLDIEKATGISNQNLSRWEQGKVIPSIAFCEILADYYGITLDELVGRDFPQDTEKAVRISDSFNNNSGNINFKS